jgi:hypothetical protein
LRVLGTAQAGVAPVIQGGIRQVQAPDKGPHILSRHITVYEKLFDYKTGVHILEEIPIPPLPQEGDNALCNFREKI